MFIARVASGLCSYSTNANPRGMPLNFSMTSRTSSTGTAAEKSARSGPSAQSASRLETCGADKDKEEKRFPTARLG
jgi:hypothetical protein